MFGYLDNSNAVDIKYLLGVQDFKMILFLVKPCISCQEK